MEQGNGEHEQQGAQSKPEEKVNYYDILGVDRDATDAVIKKAYKKKSLQLHPDKNRDDPDAESKFALLSQAYTTLLDPVKRIDHNKELAGGTVGWGWNQAAAKERAKDYKWNADDLVFNIGAQLHRARADDGQDWQEHAVRCGKFWAISVVVIALLETFVILTALGVGMPKTCAIWAAILGALLLLGLVVSIKTDDWVFPGGSLIAVVALVALLGGLVAADLFVQAKWIKESENCGKTELDPGPDSGIPCGMTGIFRFTKNTGVDVSRLVIQDSICLAPIVSMAKKSTPYGYQDVKYWAIDSGCCSGEEATCDGWDEQDFQGINWWKSERPRTVFLQDKHLGVDIHALATIITNITKEDLPPPGTPVVVEWRKNASADVRGQFDAPAWTWLVVVTLFWPLVLCLLWTAVTLGSCLFLPRMHCHQPLNTYCLYVGSGCPSCWSELDLVD